jgi:hypothetical protein
MTEAVSTPTTAPPIGKIADAVYDLEQPLMEVRNVVSLLAALAASEVRLEPEGLYPVHDALHRAHEAARKAFEAAHELAQGAKTAEGAP